ncbi:MAG: hypothetical protein ACYC63_11630 [Armatimonadota bacterium]
MRPIDPSSGLRPGNLREKHAYAFTIGLLNEEPVQDFIDRVRRREKITPPEDAGELAYNLDHYSPEDYEAEAFEFAMDYIEHPTPAEMGKIDPSEIDVAEYIKENPLLLTPPGMMEGLIMRAIPLGDIRSDTAKVIARHIVVGYMELPEPIFSVPPGWVLPVEDDGVPQVIMIAGPGCDLNKLIAIFRETCRETFGTGQRDRGPDLAAKTAWQRSLAKYLRRHGEDEGRIDQKVAAQSFEIWPGTNPPFDVFSPQYEAAICDEADRYRSNSANFKEWLDSIFGPDEEPQT